MVNSCLKVLLKSTETSFLFYLLLLNLITIQVSTLLLRLEISSSEILMFLSVPLFSKQISSAASHCSG